MTRKPAHPVMSIEQLSRAAAAVETIAQNNKQLLRVHYGTDASDVMALVSMARANWYQQSKKGGK